MKKILLFFTTIICSISFSQSTLVGLVLETVDNSSAGFTNGEVTYRLYAELDGGLITFIFADESNPLEISTSSTFVDDQFGSDIQGLINPAFFGPFPSLEYDTWLTIGDSYSDAAGTTPGLDLSSGFSGSSLSLGGTVNSDVAIFRTPDNPLCLPDANGYVLLGQFTTTGELSGFINLMGQDANGNEWTESNIPIPSMQVEVLGCTDPSAYNYDASANTDDGSCIAIVNGCTDPSASNYDSSANTDDGSCTYVSSSTLVGLVLETVDNSSAGFTNGEVTYRLYAELDGGLITFIFADESNPLEISTSSTFVDDQFGSDIQGLINPAFFGFFPSLEYDTWLTIGDSYSDAAGTTPGLDLSSGFSGSSLSLGGTVNSDVAIFRTPDNPLCLPDANGYVLLGQFTTTGELSGFINLMGQDANGNEWTESNIPIPSMQVEVLGCTDPSAYNYDASANTDDGSCIAIVNGCTDPSASNYDSSANTDDGSCTYVSSSTLVGLVLETVDNSSAGFTNGEVTYRLYAELDGGLITFIFADESNPLEISTSSTFVDDQFGSDIQGLINPAFFGFFPSLEYDTWLTIGDSYSDAAGTTPGLDLSSGFSGSSLSLGGTVNSDVAIFRTPDNPLCLPDANGYVLLGQFTTTGELSGFINLMGQDANGNEWTESNIPIPSMQVEVLGCTTQSACNYDASATDDDGSCTFADAGYDCAGNCLADADGDGVCDEFEIAGCTTQSACNYDASATDDDGSWILLLMRDMTVLATV